MAESEKTYEPDDVPLLPVQAMALTWARRAARTGGNPFMTPMGAMAPKQARFRMPGASTLSEIDIGSAVLLNVSTRRCHILVVAERRMRKREFEYRLREMPGDTVQNSLPGRQSCISSVAHNVEMNRRIKEARRIDGLPEGSPRTTLQEAEDAFKRQWDEEYLMFCGDEEARGFYVEGSRDGWYRIKELILV